MRLGRIPIAVLLGMSGRTLADPTWPAATDEIEEILYQLKGFQSRSFADNVTPCSKEVHGLGRITASEWLRTAFHDMSTANTYFGTGGLDASLMYELGDGENAGPGFNTSLLTYANYFSPKSSMSDLIALGAAVAVRAYNGPNIVFKGGRTDATSSGSLGVPQPQNDKGTFINQFSRMGFSQSEMIALVACGHTLGGVHTADFPDIVPAGTTADGDAPFDTSDAVYDNAIVNEYLNGTSIDPLEVGSSVAAHRNSDFVVFSSDSNATMKTSSDPAVFTSTCASLLQRMIEVVPAGVALTPVITPYAIKPINMQLTLNSNSSTMALSGYIRVRTTTTNVTDVVVTYRNRAAEACVGCSVIATVTGTGQGADDTFSFFSIATTILVSSGISDFTVTAVFSNGTSQTFDNNGQMYSIADDVYLQAPQSCLSQANGALTISAMIRNDRVAMPASITVYYQIPQMGIAGPLLKNLTVAMTKGPCYGGYTLFSANCSIPGGLSNMAKIDVISGTGTSMVLDSFKAASALGGTCDAYVGTLACENGAATTRLSSTMSTSSAKVKSSKMKTSSTHTTSIKSSSSATSGSSRIISSTLTPVPSTTQQTSAGSKIASTSTVSAAPSPTLSHRARVRNYALVSCWTEGSGERALQGAFFAYNGMTLESCAANCTGFNFWGAEYGRECWCGNTLATSSSTAPVDDCNMVCGGDSSEYCGAGNRLELYQSMSTTSVKATTTATITMAMTLTSRSAASSASTSKPKD